MQERGTNQRIMENVNYNCIKGYREDVHGAMRLHKRPINLKVREGSLWDYQSRDPKKEDGSH